MAFYDLFFRSNRNSIIHKKHQALIPEIAKALKEMKADGTFEKIEEDVLRKYNLSE